MLTEEEIAADVAKLTTASVEANVAVNGCEHNTAYAMDNIDQLVYITDRVDEPWCMYRT
jgi:hypothetical protein